ncbi:uncharacterized protein BX663DRAFT_526886 [Cokeromyces recurvatus]|uniref:uncharacterized protein n=1 Tax=Cokeromyces recurvatus TaxID=90255 RepID=UPI00221EE782|nr:uncharacterized protein BX663DRAFT_526886 [Cokeromyces recurvatus]KAI7897909.1 hypothetical protein BX663DRAFT_526886 [Cokeromyces recurvatus]
MRYEENLAAVLCHFINHLASAYQILYLYLFVINDYQLESQMMKILFQKVAN